MNDIAGHVVDEAFGGSRHTSAANGLVEPEVLAGIAPDAVRSSSAGANDDILRRYPKLAGLDETAYGDRVAAYAGVLAQLQHELDSSRG
ncbi:MAG: hypothetical protein LKF99_05125 [Bifidobacterium sp.]|jgi:hypothetical protein|nr:hypothetical protein [Bifidobacterium sp.]